MTAQGSRAWFRRKVRRLAALLALLPASRRRLADRILADDAGNDEG